MKKAILVLAVMAMAAPALVLGGTSRVVLAEILTATW